MWSSFKLGGAALLAFGLLGGCGKTNTTESGETHFVTCESDADCSNLTGAYTCRGGKCHTPEQIDAGAGSGAGSVTDAAPACAGGCVGGECATPGNCTLEAACAVAACNTALMDENACVRPSCVTDADCPDTERCAAFWLSRHYQCTQQGTTCACESGLGLFPVNTCSPVALAGTRGVWLSLVISESVIGDSTVHTITPDGAVTLNVASPDGSTTTTTTSHLSPEDLDELTRLVNGPNLRLDLSDATPCPVTKEYDAVVDLRLTSVKLRKNVAGCLGAAGTGTVSSFQSLMDVIRRY